MKIFMIGGTGNISSPITKRLLRQGHDVTLYNHDAQPPEWLDGANVVTGDRKDHAALERCVAELGTFDCAIDMLCFDPEDAESDIRAFRSRTQQFIACSTVDVYSKTPARYPVDETADLGASASFPYGYKKAQCERLLWAAHAAGDFNLTVLRPSFTYNETWSPGIHSFGGQTYHLDRLRKGKPILMHGDGTSIWVATFCEDTAGAFIGAVGNPRAFGQGYIVSGDEWMTHNYIWQTIARLLGAPPPRFVYVPTELLAKLAPQEAEWCAENFRYNNLFDNSKAKRDLGFRYTVSFEQGVKTCLDWLTSRGKIEDCENYPFYDRIIERLSAHRSALISEFQTNPV